LAQSSNGQIWHEELLQDMKENDIEVPDEFAPMVYPVVEDIPMLVESDNGCCYICSTILMALRPFLRKYCSRINPWMELTDNYSYAWIEKYVYLYSTKDSRLALLDRIEASMYREQKKKKVKLLRKLRSRITRGQMLNPVLYEKDLQDHHEPDNVEMNSMSEMLNLHIDDLKNLIKQYKQEYDDALAQCEEQKKTYERKLALLKANYESIIKELEEKIKPGEVGKCVKDELAFPVVEMLDHVKERFSKAAAEEFITMYYRLALKFGKLDEKTCEMIDGIIPAIILREKSQNVIDIASAGQVNISPQQVINSTEEVK